MDHKEATLDSLLVHHKDLFFMLVSRADNKGCKMQHRGFRLLNSRFSTLISSFPILHRRHLSGTIFGRILYLEDLVSTMGRMDTLLIGVHRGNQTKP
jgi:hypothetical protein